MDSLQEGGTLLFQYFIFPLEWLMAQIFALAYNLTGNPAWSILLLSAVVNTILLPLYFLGDKIQRREQAQQARLQPKMEEFRRAFEGATLHMVQQTFYRQQGYHPIYALRSSIGFAIQVPFFIAAYGYLSHLELLQGVSWGPIADLARPDALIQLSLGNPIHLLPLAMTVLNLLSGWAYTLQNEHSGSQKQVPKQVPKQASRQLWGIALLFLILLYHSPAALLLYWSFSNLYSLVKNLITASFKHGLLYWEKLWRSSIHALKTASLWLFSLPYLRLAETALALMGLFLLARFKVLDSLENRAQQAWFWGIVCWYAFAVLQVVQLCFKSISQKAPRYLKGAYLHIFLILAAYYLIRIPPVKAALNTVQPFLIPALFLGISLAWTILPRLWCNRVYQSLVRQKKQAALLSYSCCIALLGLVFFNISSLLYSSPTEDPQAIVAFFQKILPGILFILGFLILGAILHLMLHFVLHLVLRFRFPRLGQKSVQLPVLLAFGSSAILLLALSSTFVLKYDYGVMTSWVFDQPEKLFISFKTMLMNLMLIPILYFAWWFLLRRITVFITLCWIFAASLWLSSAYYSHSLAQIPEISTAAETPKAAEASPEHIYSYSREDNNVIIIMLDRFIGPYLKDILELEPELKTELDGFTWYSNTVSPGPLTISGLTALLGGQEYSPKEIVELPGSLRDKVNQAYLMLPLLFQRNGYQVTVSDPSWANFDWRGDLDLYRQYGIRAERLKGRYTGKWLQNSPSSSEPQNQANYVGLLLMQSVFRSVPSPVAPLIYDDGSWLGSNFSSESLFTDLLKTWSTLTVLPEISDNRATGPTFTFMTNDTPHEPLAMGYKPQDERYPLQPVMQTEDPEKGPLPPKLLQELLVNSDYSLRHFYADWATMKETVRYLNWMKQQGVYDNSLIILASDHGRDVQLPGIDLGPKETDYAYFMPLLLVKAPEASGPLQLNSEARSSSEVPAFASQALAAEQRINPFTGKKIRFQSGPRGAYYITQNPSDQLSDRFRIERSYMVQGSIFRAESWQRVD